MSSAENKCSEACVSRKPPTHCPNSMVGACTVNQTFPGIISLTDRVQHSACTQAPPWKILDEMWGNHCLLHSTVCVCSGKKKQKLFQVLYCIPTCGYEILMGMSSPT